LNGARDVSARNVFCSTSGRAKLIDFGVMSPMGVSKQVVGTPPFVAPESLQLQVLDGRADLYSLGVSLYECAALRPMFPEASSQAVLVAHAIETAPPLAARRPDVPPLLAAMVARLLEKRPEDRPQHAEDVIRVLDGVATPSGGSATIPALRPRARRRWPLVAAAIAVLALAVGGFFWGYGRTDAVASERRPVLLAMFTARSADSTLADIVTQTLRSDLAQSPAVVLLSPDRVAEALARSGRSRDTRVDLPLARELAQREGAVATVGGEVSELGGQTLLLARIVDP